MKFKTVLADTVDGNATYGIASVWDEKKECWKTIGTTPNFYAYPRGVRARDSARSRCKKYAALFGVAKNEIQIENA